MSVEFTAQSATPRTSPKTPARSPYPPENRVLETTGSNSNSNGDLHQLPLRSLGVHTILNPADSQLPGSGGRTEENVRDPRASSTGSNSSPHISPPFLFHGQGMSRHGYTTPTLEDQPPTAPSSAERNSPGTARPYPPIAAARRVLTPRSPQLISPVQGHTPRTQSQHLPTGSQDSSRIVSSEAGVTGRSDQSLSTRSSPLAQQFNRVSPTVRPPTMAPLPASRPLSQPIPNHPDHNLQGRPYFTTEGPGIQPAQPSGYPPHNPYASVIHPTHSAFQAGGDPRWSGGNEHALQFSTGGVRNFAFGEGQAALRIQPAHGEPFIVPVDTHQGSRQADEKRQRNAGASQRFRKRKKDRETQERLEHQRMENQYREMEARIQALETERERIRSDRDRLRDIIYRTPSLSEFAYQGPPSPEPNNGSSPPLGPRASYSAADPETGERASQRRRTDPQVGYGDSPYGSSSGSLPPISSSGYPTSISHPGTPATRPQVPQLPPLRLGSASGTPTNGASGASTPVQACQQLKREQQQYETGWVTTPRTSSDPLQR